MAVLVTGASGMIGGQVAEALLARGERVVCFDQRPPPDGGLAAAGFVRGDLNDAPLLFGTFKRHGIRRVVHAGAISAPFIEADNPFLVCRINILGTLHVYEAARMFEVERVVNFGSVAGYGDVREGTITEDTPYAPTSVYGVTKAAGDMLGTVYAKDHGLDVISLRPSLVYGPRRPSYEPVREMIRGALAGRTAVLPAHPGLTFRGVYARDVARAVLAALDAPTVPRRSYNVGGGQAFTLAEVTEIVGRIVPGVQVEFGGESGTQAGEERAGFDISAAARDLGYRPAWPLERGAADYASWLRTHDV